MCVTLARDLPTKNLPRLALDTSRRPGSIKVVTGIDHLKANRYNLLGPFRRPTSGRANLTPSGEEPPRLGEFRVPSLRNVERTAPYMHNGSLATLEDVVSHYSELNVERLHATSNGLLQP